MDCLTGYICPENEKEVYMKVLVAYNGSLNSKAAIRHGIRKIRQHGGTLTVLYVFHRSMFIDYDAGPLAEITARDEASRFVDDAEKIIAHKGMGAWSRVVLTEGNPADEIARFVEDEDIGLIFLPQHYASVAANISCPACIVPHSPHCEGPDIIDPEIAASWLV